MVRTYKRKTVVVSEEKKKQAAAAMVKNKWSIQETAREMKLPYSSLRDFLKREPTVGPTKPGRQPIFTHGEELAFVSHLKVVGDFGQPVDKFGLRLIVQAYLNKAKRDVPVNLSINLCMYISVTIPILGV